MADRMFVEGSPQLSASVPAQTAVGIVAGVILVANGKRKGFIIQNTGTTVIKLAFGGADATPTQTAYHIALRGGTGADDATGTAYFDSSWVGDVWAISDLAGRTCVVSEFRSGSPDWNLAGDWGIS